MDYEKLVAYYAWKAVRKCPSLDREDVKQELTISMLEAKSIYDPNTDLDLANFIGRKLSWRTTNIVRDHIRHVKAETKWAYSQTYTTKPNDNSYDALCYQIIKILDTKMNYHSRRKFSQAKSLFQLMAYPESASGNIDQCKPKSFDPTNICKYLGISQIAKPIAEVRKAVRKVIDG